jgi:DNA-directed RNA polymerase specialized sigma24 family protein
MGQGDMLAMRPHTGETLELHARRGKTLTPDASHAEFQAFIEQAEPRLRRAFVAAFGPERGLEATAEALAYAWERWQTLRSFENPVGYLYKVGRSRTRSRKVRRLFARPESPDHWTEPNLGRALSSLPEPERVAVVVVYCTDMTRSQAAAMVGISESALQKRAERGLTKLRRTMGANDD